MGKKLSIDDLIAEKEKKETVDEGLSDEIEDLYDLIIPPGTPSYIIYDIVEEFELEPVDRSITVNIIESNERDVIALRGPLDRVQEAEKYLFEELRAWVNE
ncbi:hypothetical protein [Methanosalsum natronophilum]|uniref:Uncharacterized protein n=1 Tax=Methanosalsum natronophilum TaxID=768733 RepID=A0A3R7YGU7_9EURY|nr:hypothetical protein [Methanosalsum natronophilum]MCS3924774.1 hypothetical protein [Methanosalsum natronophilum]RQD82897.1 MAG: hypothetical protein D5R95_06665 [Methanosalsum natronophilum]